MRRRGTYFCPGRVNLIGEHIDYNGGLVLPAAISLGITGHVERNGGHYLIASSTSSNDIVSIDLNDIRPMHGHWADYVIGVVLSLKGIGICLEGCNVHFSSTLPQGAGLSSSAALEVLTFYMLHHFFSGMEPDRIDMALTCQQVENRHIGVNCGIMDQFAVALGQHDHALLLDCSTLEHRSIPVRSDDHELVIIDSKAPRTLASSAYNERRKECDLALGLLRKGTNLEHLAQAELSGVNRLEDETLRKRARHVVSEHHRVTLAAQCLSQGDLRQFGQLLNSSHASLRDDYEVSSRHLDLIVETAQEEKGCLGARLTGAGFGGCCIALIEKSATARFKERLEKRYFESFGMTIGLHSCRIADGVHELTD